MKWTPGAVFLTSTHNLPQLVDEFLVEHLYAASRRVAHPVLASYTMPSPAIMDRLLVNPWARVAVSDVVQDVDLGGWQHVRRVSPPGGAMHHKFVVCGDHALIGSWNFGAQGGCNSMVYLWGGATRTLRAEFDRVWAYEAAPALTQGEATELVALAVRHGGRCGFTDACWAYVATRGTLTGPQVRALRAMCPPGPAQEHVEPEQGKYDDDGNLLGNW